MVEFTAAEKAEPIRDWKGSEVSELDLFTTAGDGPDASHFGLTDDGAAYVVAGPFAKALGYRDAANATRLLDDAEAGTQIVSIRSANGIQQKREVSVIFEDGIWELIFRSTLPSAKSIKSRVKAILRELRETGVVDTRSEAPELPHDYESALVHLLDKVRENKALTARVAEQAPMVEQAKAHRAGVRSITRTEFAREIVGWAATEHGVKVLHEDVFAFLEHLRLFVRGERSDSGHATTDAIRRDLAETDKGTAKSGFNYATGKLTPKGQGYAWDRIARHIEANGTLVLPRRIA